MHRAQRHNAAAHRHQQGTPCVRGTSIWAVLLWVVVSSEPAVRSLPSAFLSSLLLCVCGRSTPLWTDTSGPFGLRIITSTVLISPMFEVIATSTPPQKYIPWYIRCMQRTQTKRYNPTQQRKQQQTTSRACGTSAVSCCAYTVVVLVVALSEAAIHHQASPPLFCFCCACVFSAFCIRHEQFEYESSVIWSNGHHARVLS